MLIYYQIYLSVMVAIICDGGMTFNIDRAQSHGILRNESTVLAEISAFTVILGRILYGYILDVLISRICLSSTMTLLMFVAAWSSSVLAVTFASQAIWFGVYGLFNGANGTFVSFLVK